MPSREIQIPLDDLPEILWPHRPLIQRYGRVWTETEIDEFLEDCDEKARQELLAFAQFYTPAIHEKVSRWIKSVGGLMGSPAAAAVYWASSLAIAVEGDETDDDETDDDETDAQEAD